MNDSLSVNKIESFQSALLRELRLSALSNAPYAFGAKYDEEIQKPISAYEADANRHAQSENSTTFILFAGSEPAGLIGAFTSKEPEQRSFICSLWVRPENRQLGGGRLLVRTTCTWFLERNVHTVYAWVADSNTKANSFYKSLGFDSAQKRQQLPSNPAEWETLLFLSTEKNC
jgi:ribosomal protein S18 acetylase RimI-like enzyme